MPGNGDQRIEHTTGQRGADAPARAAAVLARQDRIPVWSLPAIYLVIIGIGYFFTFFDIADIGYGMPAISKQFHLSSGEGTFVALAVGLVGYFVGIGVTGAIAGLIALLGPRTSGRSLERVSH